MYRLAVKATIFLTLDANGGYWQAKRGKQDRNKMAFNSHYGFFRLIQMPFGLKNAQRTLQLAMDVLRMRVKWQIALGYLDDNEILLRTPGKYI